MAHIKLLKKQKYTLDIENPSTIENISEEMAFAKPIQAKAKKRSWIDVFTPAAYRDIDLKEALTSKDIKAAAENVGDALKPKSFTK